MRSFLPPFCEESVWFLFPLLRLLNNNDGICSVLYFCINWWSVDVDAVVCPMLMPLPLLTRFSNFNPNLKLVQSTHPSICFVVFEFIEIFCASAHYLPIVILTKHTRTLKNMNTSSSTNVHLYIYVSSKWMHYRSYAH